MTLQLTMTTLDHGHERDLVYRRYRETHWSREMSFDDVLADGLLFKCLLNEVRNIPRAKLMYGKGRRTRRW